MAAYPPGSSLERNIQPDNLITAAISGTVNTEERVSGAREGGRAWKRCADHFLNSAFSSFLLLQLGLFVGYLSVMQCADGHCCMCQSHLVRAASFPDLTPHPSPFLRSRHPTRSALPTADSEVTTGKAVTAIAVWHLFYLWFLLHRKLQD